MAIAVLNEEFLGNGLLKIRTVGGTATLEQKLEDGNWYSVEDVTGEIAPGGVIPADMDIQVMVKQITLRFSAISGTVFYQ